MILTRANRTYLASGCCVKRVPECVGVCGEDTFS